MNNLAPPVGERRPTRKFAAVPWNTEVRIPIFERKANLRRASLLGYHRFVPPAEAKYIHVSGYSE